MKTLLLASALALTATGCATRPDATATAAPPAIANAGAPEPGVFTGGRFGAGEVPLLKDSGVKHVIDLTQESESPDFDEEAALAAADIEYDRLPINGADGLTRDNVVAFDRLLASADEPVLVHCGASNRVGAMAALRAGWLQGKDIEEALAIGREWGLKGLEPAVWGKLEAGR
jgi:uncharacterized protein (TIGR01244 family)